MYIINSKATTKNIQRRVNKPPKDVKKNPKSGQSKSRQKNKEKGIKYRWDK